MDGTPQVVRFDATTLWHLDAAEWAPSTASIAAEMVGRMRRSHVRFAPKADKHCAKVTQAASAAMRRGFFFARHAPLS